MKSCETNLHDLQTIGNRFPEYFPICQIDRDATSCEPQTLQPVSTSEAVYAY